MSLCSPLSPARSTVPALAGVTKTEGSMMAKYKRKNPESVADRLRWLALHVEGFTAQRGQSGYSAATIRELTRLLACWAEWMRNAGFDIDSIETGLAASAAVFRGGRTARAQGAAALFVAYLRRHGVLPLHRSAPNFRLQAAQA
jgi:integrase/recombinase XerD